MNFHDKEPANFDHIDIYAKDGKCPVCKSEIDLSCDNGCYLQISSYLSIRDEYKPVLVIKIFEEDFYLHQEDENSEMNELEIAKQISYWKENDRYLAKILES